MLPTLLKSAIFCLVLAAAAQTASAQGRYFVGARNLAMGNTGVAHTTDSMAVHFNPAGMAFSDGWDIQLPLITADAEVDSDLFRLADTIHDRFLNSSLDEIQSRLEDGTATFEDLQTTLAAFLYDLPALGLIETGGTARGAAGLTYRHKNWGFSTTVLGNGGVGARVDLENGLSLSSTGFAAAIPNPTTAACSGDPTCLDFAAQLVAASSGTLDQDRAETLVAAAGSGLTDGSEALDVLTKIVVATSGGDGVLADNLSGAFTTTLTAVQFTGTYSHLIYRDKLSIGGSLRVMQGEASRVGTSVADLESGENTLTDALTDAFDRVAETSTEVGLDLGLMYRPTSKWSFGLVGNNINSPSFSVATGSDLELEALIRVGAAYTPFKWFSVAADADLNEIDGVLGGAAGSQYINLGVEFTPGRVFSGWIGAYENTARVASLPTYTGGIGLRFGRFQLSLAGAVSDNEVRLTVGEDSQLYPDGAAASITLAWLPKRNL